MNQTNKKIVQSIQQVVIGPNGRPHTLEETLVINSRQGFGIVQQKINGEITQQAIITPKHKEEQKKKEKTTKKTVKKTPKKPVKKTTKKTVKKQKK